jgi:rubredoxin
LNKEVEMKKYVCNVCGYVYNPADGDSDSGIVAGPLSKIFPKTGFARSVEPARMLSKCLIE